jgi:hypothetical protein
LFPLEEGSFGIDGIAKGTQYLAVKVRENSHGGLGAGHDLGFGGLWFCLGAARDCRDGQLGAANSLVIERERSSRRGWVV